MSISVAKLLSYLKQNVESSCPDPMKEVIGLGDISCIGSETDIHLLYTGDYSEMNNLKYVGPVNLLLYADTTIPADEFKKGNNIIAVSSKAVYRSIICKIQRELADDLYIGECSAHFLSLVQNSSNVQDVVNYGYELLQNPILAVDISFDFVACAGTDSLDDEPVWQYTIVNGFMPSDYLDCLMKYDYEAGESWEDPSKLLILEEKAQSFMKHDQIAARIMQDKRAIGYVKLLEKNKPISELDKKILVLLSRYISIILLKTVNTHSLSYSITEEFLMYILINSTKNREHIESRQNLFGIKLYDNLQVITIQMKDNPPMTDQKFFLLKKFKKYFERNNVILINNYIVVLYDTKMSSGTFSESEMEKFKSILDENNCQANVSFPFRNLKDLYYHYEQTMFCIKVRQILNSTETIVRYEDIIEYHMIIHFSELINLNFIIHPKVLKLMEHDKENSSDYVETLFTYLRNQQDLSKTAKAMFVHYNTMKYRLNRIVTMTDIDFNNDREVFMLAISERILTVKRMTSDKN